LRNKKSMQHERTNVSEHQEPEQGHMEKL
jgi:hypothetical protein